MSQKPTEILKIAENKKAHFNYAIEDTIECGIALVGSEVKSLRAHHLSFKDSYCLIKNQEVLIIGLRIEPFDKSTHEVVDPERTRKLLLHKKEIRKLDRLISQQGASLIPLKIYIKNYRVKILIGIGFGKAKSDKRKTIKDREVKRELSRVLKRG